MQELVYWLSAWYNLVFLVPLAIGAGFLLIEIATGGAGEIFGLDLDFDSDLDADLDADLPAWVSGLNWVGVGLIPLTIVLEVFLVSFGFCGLMANALVSDIWPWGPNLAFLVVAPASFLVAMLLTKLVSRFLWKVFFHGAQEGTKLGKHVGEIGMTSQLVEETMGEVRIHPHGGEVLYLSARTRGLPPIAFAEEVILVGFDPNRGVYYVEPTQTENSDPEGVN